MRDELAVLDWAGEGEVTPPDAERGWGMVWEVGCEEPKRSEGEVLRKRYSQGSAGRAVWTVRKGVEGRKRNR
jgi:hypothetical protein